MSSKLLTIFISAVCFIAAAPVSALSAGAQKAWVQQIEKRLAVTSSVLGDMKAVKMLGLTDVLYSIISVLRKVELKTSTKLRKLILLQVAICKAEGYPENGCKDFN